MKYTARLFSTLLLCVISTTFTAQADNFFSRNRVSVSGSLTSSDVYTIETSYHYMFCRYIGAGIGVGNWTNYYDDGWAAGDDWQVSDDDNRPQNFYLRPSVVLKTPGIKIRNVRLGLYAEPGLLLNIPYQSVCIERYHYFDTDYDHISTTKGQWSAFELRVGLTLDIGPLGIALGYTRSNLDIYSQYRHLSYRGISFRDFYPSKPTMQGAFITLSYNIPE